MTNVFQVRSRPAIVFITLLVTGGLALACGNPATSESVATPTNHAVESTADAPVGPYHSVVYEEKRAAPLLRLERADGSTFDLASRQGRVVVVFFGYAECTYICPLTIPNFAAAMRALSPVDQDAIDFVMITVDPERETPSDAQRYVARYDERFIGLGGTPSQVNAVIERWRIRTEVEVVGTDVSPTGYSIGHSSYMLVVNQHGDLRLKMSQQMTATEITEDLQVLLREG